MTTLDIQSQFAGFDSNIPLRIFVCQGGKNTIELVVLNSNVTLSDNPDHQVAVLNLQPIDLVPQEKR